MLSSSIYSAAGDSSLSSASYKDEECSSPVYEWDKPKKSGYRRRLRSPTLLVLLIVATTAVVTWMLTYTSSPSPPDMQPHQHNNFLTFPANTTLNFAQIFAINLAFRYDRRDALSLMSLYTNITTTLSPGVREIAKNAVPLPRTPGRLRPEEYAVFRAHANVWRRIVEERLPNALVLEDDVDWDVKIKEQIPRVMTAAERLTTMHGSEPWDIIWLGSCGEKSRADYTQWTIVEDDEKNVAQQNYNWVEAILGAYLPSTPNRRVIQRAVAPECTHGYALSQRGARRLLFHLGQFLDDRLDLAIVDLMDTGRLVGYSVLPPLFVQFKVTKNPTKDTDAGYDVWPVTNWGFTHSTRKALEHWDMRPCLDDAWCGL